MPEATLIYPHQLFKDHPAVADGRAVWLVEDARFFGDPEGIERFHKQKLVFHRASMKAYAEGLRRRGVSVHYVNYDPEAVPSRLVDDWRRLGVDRVRLADPVDTHLSERLDAICREAAIAPTVHPTPAFMTPEDAFRDYFAARKTYYMAGFYREQRRRFGILLDDGGGPVGGKWSFDPENRKALPKTIGLPPVRFPEPNEHVAEALRYVDRRFGDNPGQVDSFGWPVTRRQALAFLDDFLAERLDRFGDYEDAVSSREPFVFHSLLSPAINAGLVTPREVVDRTLAHSGERDAPINSLEGFVRQVVGWREYMRAVYVLEGEAMRSANTFGHERPMPAAFYDASTGLEPVDCTVRRVIERGWCHHIERLMILGNVMLLCEIDPAAVYRWFMELFVDAYDWVMVPNVYGMSQYADGGSIVTKPYVSSSNYVRKMSDFGRGPWCAVWDGLYWRFIAKHRDRFAGNPRMKTMVRLLDRMKPETLRAHREAAEGFLAGLG